MYKGYRYRIYPTSQQQQLIEQTFGCCRVVYNVALETKNTVYKEHGISLSAIDLINQLSDMKRDYEWMQRVDSQALQAEIRILETTYKNFFRGLKKGQNVGFPKFKSKYGEQSFTAPNNKREIDFENGLLTISKLPNIPIRIDRRFEGKIRRVTITRVPSGKYFASILVDDGIKLPAKQPVDKNKTLGIDVGITHLAITSDGVKHENVRALFNNIKRLKVLQRRLSRKKKGSSNYKKLQKKIAILHERIANIRKDNLHKLSTKLVCKSHATMICVESLAVKNMMQNRKLAQVISDVGWGMFLTMLEYKCEWYGVNFTKIGRFQPSSKTCSNCGHVIESIALDIREWVCPTCLSSHDRDINAARNIKFMGLQEFSGRGTPVEPAESSAIAEAMKQESHSKRKRKV